MHHFAKVYEETAARPFVQRVLLPKIIHSVVALTPAGMENSVNESFWRASQEPWMKKTVPWFEKVFPSDEPAYPRVVATLIIYFCLLGYMIMLYRLAQAVFPGETAIHYLAPALGTLAISSLSLPMQHIYDFPLLFLVTACYYLLLKNRFALYLFFFTLATINKETSLFLIIFYALWEHGRTEKETYVNRLMAQGLIYLVVQISIAIAYQENYDSFSRVNIFFRVFNSLLARADMTQILNLAVLFLLLTYRWAEKPAFLKTGLWLLPIIFTLFLWFGYPHEFRVFFDVLPLLALLATHTLVAAAGFSLKNEREDR